MTHKINQVIRAIQELRNLSGSWDAARAITMEVLGDACPPQGERLDYIRRHKETWEPLITKMAAWRPS